MSNTSLFFERPLLLLLAIPALLLILLPFFRLPAKRRKSFKRIAPVVLHCLAAVLLVLILSGIAIVRTSDDQAVVLVLDFSDSTAPVRQKMVEHGDRIRELMDQNTPVSVVAFGDNCVYSLDSHALTPVAPGATNIGDALEFAYSKLPTHKAGRIILLSDGKQTDGNADSTAQYLQSRGIRIDAVYFDTSMLTVEIQINSLSAPETAYVGQDAVLVADLTCNTTTYGALILYDNDTQVSTTQIDLFVGSNLYELPVQITGSGSHTYRVEVVLDRDTIAANNSAIAHTMAVDKPSVLLIAGEKAHTQVLEEVLQETNHVTVISGTHAPRTITGLCDYDGVILCNIGADELPRDFDLLLDTYVNQYGRSLLAIGGPDTYMYGGMQGTHYEEMMPVRFSLSRSSDDDPVALMLVMDCSMSMSQQSTYMSVAKQGAIKCVEAMTENDYVGIISFNRTAVLEAPLGKNTEAHKDSLNRIISGLTTSQGTYYTDALDLAHEQLKQSNATVKHILFVSDGSPADIAYRDLLPGIVADGISISTIGLGYSSNLLETMAKDTGGQYYYVSESSDLPNIMLTLTEQISVNSLITGNFPCSVTPESILVFPQQTLPPVSGYLGTSLKKGAAASLVTQEDHPIYASWQYGVGTVACFTTDLSGSWGAQWLQNKQLVQEMVSATLPPVHRESALTVSYAVHGSTADITVQAPARPTQILSIRFNEQLLTMSQTAPGIYRVSVDIGGEGIYPVTVIQTDEGKELDRLDSYMAVSHSTEYDAFATGGEALLSAICSHSGGMVTDDPQALADVSLEAVNVAFDFMIPFGITIAVALLADIAIRKIRLKDLKNYWLILKNAKK